MSIEFEKAVQMIEEDIRQCDLCEEGRNKNLAERVEKLFGRDRRTVNAIFYEKVNRNLMDYIREKRMNKAYKYIIESDSFDAYVGIELTGYDNQNSFGKAFKKQFKMTPKEAFARKDGTVLEPEQEAGENSGGHTKKYGIQTQQADYVISVIRLQSEYELDDEQGEVGYEIAEERREEKRRKCQEEIDRLKQILDQCKGEADKNWYTRIESVVNGFLTDIKKDVIKSGELDEVYYFIQCLESSADWSDRKNAEAFSEFLHSKDAISDAMQIYDKFEVWNVSKSFELFFELYGIYRELKKESLRQTAEEYVRFLAYSNLLAEQTADEKIKSEPSENMYKFPKEFDWQDSMDEFKKIQKR